MRTTFAVPGRPIGEGSVSAIAYRKKDGSTGAVVQHRSKGPLLMYRADVQNGWDTITPRPPEPLEGPVAMRIRFSFARPKTHFTDGPTATMPDRRSRLRENAPTWFTQKPDLDKLVRSVLDALTGRAYLDDSQVVHLEVQKAYGACYTEVALEPAPDRD